MKIEMMKLRRPGGVGEEGEEREEDYHLSGACLSTLLTTHGEES